jgi:hypothetical protein
MRAAVMPEQNQNQNGLEGLNLRGTVTGPRTMDFDARLAVLGVPTEVLAELRGDKRAQVWKKCYLD